MDSIFGDGIRVLIVDDNSDAARSLATLLSLLGFNALAVFGGQQAIDLVASFRPAVVVSDLHMPIVDGFQLAQVLRGSLPDVQLIAWSSDNRTDTRDRAHTSGFSHCLRKPDGMEELLHALAGMRKPSGR